MAKKQTKTKKAAKSKTIKAIGVYFAALTLKQNDILNKNLIIVDGELVLGTPSYQPEGSVALLFTDDDDGVVLSSLLEVAKNKVTSDGKLGEVVLTTFNKKGQSIREYRYPTPMALTIGAQAYGNRSKKYEQHVIQAELRHNDVQVNVPVQEAIGSSR